MEMKKMSREKVKALFEPWAAKTNEVIDVKTIQGLLKSGTQVRGLLGLGIQEMEAPGDGFSHLEQLKDHKTEINRFRR